MSFGPFFHFPNKSANFRPKHSVLDELLIQKPYAYLPQISLGTCWSSFSEICDIGFIVEKLATGASYPLVRPRPARSSTTNNHGSWRAALGEQQFLCILLCHPILSNVDWWTRHKQEVTLTKLSFSVRMIDHDQPRGCNRAPVAFVQNALPSRNPPAESIVWNVWITRSGPKIPVADQLEGGDFLG